jgi:transcription elongation factor GreA
MTTTATPPNDYEVILTRDGYERLRDELVTLSTISRAEITDRLREARQGGEDLAENSELIDALEDQALLERRITTLEASLPSAWVVDEPPPDGTIGIGTWVRLRDIDSGRQAVHQVVGSLEADPTQHRLSAGSPVGRALLGRRTGDVLDVEAPRGRMRFRIIAAYPGRSARHHGAESRIIDTGPENEAWRKATSKRALRAVVERGALASVRRAA